MLKKKFKITILKKSEKSWKKEMKAGDCLLPALLQIEMTK